MVMLDHETIQRANADAELSDKIDAIAEAVLHLLYHAAFVDPGSAIGCVGHIENLNSFLSGKGDT